MANLDAAADKAVHDAVDAFMEGRLVPDFSGETIFETKHSRYRLRDGVVYAAPSDGLIGAELVGWLMETAHRSVVESAWQPGSRAVLVDRNRGRNIIVTSSTRLLHLEAAARSSAELYDPHPPTPLPPSWTAPAIPVPPPPARPTAFGGYAPPHERRPIQAATPPPPAVRSAPLPAPIPAPRIPAGAPVPAPAVVGGSASGPRRGVVHLPPRPIQPVRPPQGAWPTPAAWPPAPPPPLAAPERPPAAAPPPPADTPWELTSSEIELETEETLPRQSPREIPPAPESGGGAIPLVRPRDGRTR